VSKGIFEILTNYEEKTFGSLQNQHFQFLVWEEGWFEWFCIRMNSWGEKAVKTLDSLNSGFVPPRIVLRCWTAIRNTVSLSSFLDIAVHIGIIDESSVMKLFICKSNISSQQLKDLSRIPIKFTLSRLRFSISEWFALSNQKRVRILPKTQQISTLTFCFHLWFGPISRHRHHCVLWKWIARFFIAQVFTTTSTIAQRNLEKFQTLNGLSGISWMFQTSLAANLKGF
jgi:hypothetical protein